MKYLILLGLILLIVISHYVGKMWDESEDDDFDFPH